ncbi:hypothetical protein EFM55_14240 [Lactiplantibacillus pentosus]|nr:hypothetical protein CEW82_10760 [Lactiplantibacillus pentosus]MCT0163453.1 hypothetical protein [Lactiplantibacillus pentosus]
MKMMRTVDEGETIMKTSMLLQLLFSLLFFGLGCYQVIASRRYFRQVKLHGNAETSPFAAMGVWTSFVIGITFIIVGIVVGFGLAIS